MFDSDFIELEAKKSDTVYEITKIIEERSARKIALFSFSRTKVERERMVNSVKFNDH